MQVLTSLSQIRDAFSCTGPSAVAVGFFDGLHSGHREVIRQAMETAYPSVVLTFSIGQGSSPKRKRPESQLLTQRDKLSMLEGIGVDYVAVPPFEEMRAMSPDEFVQTVLKDLLHCRLLSCGYDFRYGSGAVGDVHSLQESCRRLGMTLLAAPPVMLDGTAVSSTRIRDCLIQGKTEEANRLLGYRYFIDEIVTQGNQLGRQRGYPTINQTYPEELLVPKYGVYASRTLVNGVWYASVTNIGVKPTIAGQRSPLAETNILGFEGDLYGKRMRVELLSYLRGEKKFESVDALYAQIQSDADTARQMAERFMTEQSRC